MGLAQRHGLFGVWPKCLQSSLRSRLPSRLRSWALGRVTILDCGVLLGYFSSAGRLASCAVICVASFRATCAAPRHRTAAAQLALKSQDIVCDAACCGAGLHENSIKASVFSNFVVAVLK